MMTSRSSSGLVGDNNNEQAVVVEIVHPQIPGIILFLLVSSTLCLVFNTTTWVWVVVATLGFLLAAAAYVCSRRRRVAAADAASAASTTLAAGHEGITCSQAQALLSDCFSWQRATNAAFSFTSSSSASSSSSSSSSSYLRLGRRRLFGHRLAIEEGVALSRGEVDAARLQLLLVEGDFSSEHYELLSRLDEDLGDTPNSMGATQAELDRLPTYVVDMANKTGQQKKCFICLDTFEAGDRIRILPCMHQFHQESCGDAWLRIKMQCPVCKIML